MNYYCCDEIRRRRADEQGLNGIEFLQVIDEEAKTYLNLPGNDWEAWRQRILVVHMVNEKHLGDLKPENVLIEGGQRIKNIVVTEVKHTPPSKTLEIRLDRSGDFSPYRLRFIKRKNTTAPPENIDSRLACVQFSFKVECPSDFDCASRTECPGPARKEPAINYLAKDYASFRQLVLDRMAAIIPDWQDRNAADMGMVLVELLAYVGDHLSYQQDATMTEAYLGTARRRISLRRHARLMDYRISEGHNARTWVHLTVRKDSGELPKGTTLLTRTSFTEKKLGSKDKESAIDEAAFVFETTTSLRGLFVKHNEIKFYTWSDRSCCLPRGATSATLRGHYPNLQAGDFLLLEEAKGPKNGNPADANPERRHIVRLKEVRAFKVVDGADVPLDDPVEKQEITEITWFEDDRLPFPLCVSAVVASQSADGNQEEYQDDISVVRGNMVPADHGCTVDWSDRSEDWPVPEPSMYYAASIGGDPCRDEDPESVPIRYRPRLLEGPLTHANDFDVSAEDDDEIRTSATSFLNWDGKSAKPQIWLKATKENMETNWNVQRDLLSSRSNDSHFVAEVDDEGHAILRFGDGTHGERPDHRDKFQVKYRIGNGATGNIGAEALTHIVTDDGKLDISEVTNPLPAKCGRDPESAEDIRQRVPIAFRTTERAVTVEDYATLAERLKGVQRAAATSRWTGSWNTVFVSIDRRDGLEVDKEFRHKMLRHLETYRCAGYDVEVNSPIFVALKIVMEVCVDPDHLRGHVKQALLEKFSADRLPNGTLGLFHPDNYTFGQSVYSSPLISAAQKTPGVTSARLVTFERQRSSDKTPLEKGVLPIGRLEVARLDNDPNFRENGEFQLILRGGQ